MARETWLVDSPRTIDFELVRTLKVALIGGQVDVVAHDEPGARVEVHSVRGKPLKVELVGDTLEIDHPQLRWDNFLDVFASFRGSARADVSIMIPRDVALKFGVVSADALISGITDDASISAVSGDVTIDGVYGDLELNGVSGEFAVRNHYGAIHAKTVSGDFTASGEIMTLAGRTVSGDVMLDLAGVPDKVDVKTVSGDVTMRLEADVPAQYSISTVSGSLQLDDSSVTGVRGRYTGKYGDLAGRWVEFGATTVSGNISVVHAEKAGV